MIIHFTLVFDDLASPLQHEMSLPLIPSEPKPKFDYGSSYTRTHTLVTLPSNSLQKDFTPTLPLRPSQSIHSRSHVQKKEVNRRSILSEDLSIISEDASDSSAGLISEAADGPPMSITPSGVLEATLDTDTSVNPDTQLSLEQDE